MFRTGGMVAAVLLGVTIIGAQTVSLSGTVIKSGGTDGIQGVKVHLVNKPDLNVFTDAQGAFSITGPVNVQRKLPQTAGPHYLLAGTSLIIQLCASLSSGRVELYSGTGRRIASIPFKGRIAGNLRVDLPESGSGLFILRIVTPEETVTRTIVRSGDALYCKNADNGIDGNSKFSVMRLVADAAVDTLVATKAGYATGKVAVDTYSKAGITISLKPSVPGGCTSANLPSFSELTVANEKLPDPFTFYDGTRMTRKDQWECRRQEILNMASKYLYGPFPPEPDSVWGTVAGDSIKVSCRAGTKTADFTASVGSGSGAVLCLDMAGAMAPDDARLLKTDADAAAKLKTLFAMPEILPLLAQAWLIDRIIEVLKMHPSGGFDPAKMMVSGCSGCGKGALVVGAYSHIPLTVIVESGEKGVASLRMNEWFRYGAGKSVWSCADATSSIDVLEDNGICGPWFLLSAAGWLRTEHQKVPYLPFDQHCLLACIAPRACLSMTNQNGKNEWCHLAGTCEALSAWAAEPVWNALGVPDNFGFLMYSEESSPAHCSEPASAKNIADKFFRRVFAGDSNAVTDVMIFGGGPQDLQQPQSEWKEMWVDWDMNTHLE